MDLNGENVYRRWIVSMIFNQDLAGKRCGCGCTQRMSVNFIQMLIAVMNIILLLLMHAVILLKHCLDIVCFQPW